MNTKEQLLTRAVNPKTLRHGGIYTSPRSFGVYRVPINSGGTHRFGNHPIRQAELTNEFGECEVLAIF